MPTRRLEIEIIGDPASFNRASRSVSSHSKRMGDDVDKSGKRIRGFATISSSGMKRVGVAAGGMAAAGAAGAALLAKSFVSGASDLDEQINKINVVFGRNAASVEKWSRTTAESMGTPQREALAMAGTFGNLLTTLGFAQPKAADMSKQFVKLGADMASFNNANPEDTLAAIRSGLTGEIEPLRRYGVFLSAARVAQEAMRLGLVKTTTELTEQDKVQARHSLLLKDTTKQQGDFARTSGGLANQQRILKARLADTAAELGGKLMPSALRGVKALNSLFDSSTSGGRAMAAVGRAAKTAGEFIKDSYGAAARAVTRWVRQNREEIATAVKAFQNLGRAVQFWFEEVVLPVIRKVIQRILPIIDSLKDTLSGLVRFVTSILTGQWGKAWEAAKDVVTGQLRTIKNAIVGYADIFLTVMKSLGKVIIKGLVAGLSGLGKAVKNAIVSGVKEGVNAASGAVSDVIGKINPFGDGIGHLAKKVGEGLGHMPLLGGGTVGGFGGNLDGADPHMRPFAAIGQRFGLGVSDGLRPGGITSSGNVSLHATGDALDLAGPGPRMLAYFKHLRSRFGSRLQELIYTPGKIGIKNGQLTPIPGPIYDQRVANDHYDHVHVGFTGGALGDGTGHRKPRTGDGIGRAGRSTEGLGGGRKKELAWMQSVWDKTASYFGRSAGPIKGLFKHIRMGASQPFVGVTRDPGAGPRSSELLWPSWIWQGGNGLDKASKTQLMVHELAHRFQDDRATDSARKAEGGAEAFARRLMRPVFGLRPQPSGPYTPDRRWVESVMGDDWIMRGQFGEMGAAASMAGKRVRRAPIDDRNIIQSAASRGGIDPAILYGVWGAESNFSHGPGPTSPAGAIGPFQFMPATAQAYGVNPTDFKSSAFGAGRYLGQYKGRGVSGMLAAYNAGPAGNPNNAETRAYIPKVLAIAKRWGGGKSGGAPGASGGGGGTANKQVLMGKAGLGRPGTPASGLAPGSSRGGFIAGSLGMEGALAAVGVRKAKAEARDDLSGLVKALVEERSIKRRRLKRIRKVLKGRLSKKRRIRLLEEEATLIGEIGDLTESIKEYKADAKGGATTISRAEELEAGVDTSAGEVGVGGDAGGGETPATDPALEEHNRLLEQQNALLAEQNANQQKILALAGQGPAILASVVAAVNGGIGGRVGIGFQSVGYAPGTVAAY